MQIDDGLKNRKLAALANNAFELVAIVDRQQCRFFAFVQFILIKAKPEKFRTALSRRKMTGGVPACSTHAGRRTSR